MHRAMITPGPDAIERWAKLVPTVQFQTLTDEQFNALAKFKFYEHEMEDNDDIKRDLSHNVLGLASVLWNRINYCHTYKISVAAVCFLGCYVLENFGMSTMIANYLQWVAYTNNCREIDLDVLCFKGFPNGFPTKKEWEDLWDAQKLPKDFLADEGYIGPDNILDLPSFMESIKNIEHGTGKQ